MKVISNIAVAFLLFCLISCVKDENIPAHLSNDIRIEQEYVLKVTDFAKALNKAIVENTDFRKLLKSEVIKQIDGDYDLLVSNSLNMNVNPSSLFVTKSSCADTITVKELLSYYYGDSVSLTKGSSQPIDELLEEYPDLQISVPVNAEEWDPESYTPDIAIVPLDYGSDIQTLSGVDSDGNLIEIDAVNAPSEPVIVVGRSERLSEIPIIKPIVVPTLSVSLSGVYTNGAIRLTYSRQGFGIIDSLMLYKTLPNSSTYEYLDIEFSSENKYVDWNIIEGKEYSYYLVAKSRNSLGIVRNIISNTFTIIADSSTPNPVSNLHVVNEYAEKNYLTWDNNPYEDYYTKIYRTTSEITDELIATLDPDKTYYYDEDVTPGEKWIYHVVKYNTNNEKSSKEERTFLYNPYRNPSAKSKVMLRKINIDSDQVEGWFDGKPEFYITTFGTKMSNEGNIQIDTLSSVDYRFKVNGNSSESLNCLLADWSFYDDSVYYPILNIHMLEYDRGRLKAYIKADAKVGVKLNEDISIQTIGTFEYTLANNGQECGTVQLRYYENPSQTLVFSNLGASIDVSE